MSFAALALAAALLQADEQPTVLQPLTVEAAPPTRQAARRYVDGLAGAPMAAISLATWRTPICLDLQNLKPQAAALLGDRIAARAEKLGVKVVTVCPQPNVLVIATADGRQTAESLVRTGRRGFLPYGDTQAGPQALERFAERDAPVRWWTIAAQYDTEARVFVEPLWGDTRTRPVDTTGSLYFNSHLVRAMVRAVVIIDASKTAAAPLEALADYIARVVLAETNPEARTAAYSTVLNLWGHETTVGGLTTADERYLAALYCAGVRQPGSGSPIGSVYQLNEIARRMARPKPDCD